MKLKEIQNLIKFVAKSGASEVKLEMEDVKITIKTNDGTQPVVIQEPISVPQQQIIQTPMASQQPPVVDSKPEDSEDNSNYVTVKSPIIGTFYRKPSPDDPPFIKVGDQVKKGDVLCIIEAMKVMNEIQADFAGEIAEILVEDSSSVEYGQPLLKIKKN